MDMNPFGKWTAISDGWQSPDVVPDGIPCSELRAADRSERTLLPAAAHMEMMGSLFVIGSHYSGPRSLLKCEVATTHEAGQVCVRLEGVDALYKQVSEHEELRTPASSFVSFLVGR